MTLDSMLRDLPSKEALWDLAIEYLPTLAFVLIAYIAASFLRWLQNRIRFVRAVNRLPGPSLKNHPYPWTADLGPIFNAPLVEGVEGKIPDQVDIFINITKEYAEHGLVRQWGFNPYRVPFALSFVMVWEESLVKDILLTKGAFEKPLDGAYRPIMPLFGDSILTTSDGPHWKMQRKAASISQSILQKACGHVQDLLYNVLFPYLDSLSDTSNAVDVYKYAKHLTADVIGRVSYGQDFGAVSSLTTGKACQLYNDIVFIEAETANRSKEPLRGILRSATNRMYHSKLQSLNRFMQEQIRQKRKLPLNPDQDLLSNMLADDRIDDKHLLGNLKVFFYGGLDSTASTMSWALWHLASEPAYQERLFEELKDLGERPTHKELESCKFLNRILRETLRLYAPTLISRVAKRDINIGKGDLQYLIPKGCSVFVYPLCANRILGDDADQFNPDRSVGESGSGLHFSTGFRNCLGQGLASTEIRAALASIVRRYKLTAATSKPPKLYLNLNFNPHGAFVKFESRAPQSPGTGSQQRRKIFGFEY